MRIARLLTVFEAVCLLSGGLPSHGNLERQTPREQTNTCENITFPQLRLRAAIIVIQFSNMRAPEKMGNILFRANASASCVGFVSYTISSFDHVTVHLFLFNFYCSINI